MYARSHQRKLRQMSCHYPHLPVASAAATVAAATTARPIGNNFGNIKLVGPNWRLLSACLRPPGRENIPRWAFERGAKEERRLETDSVTPQSSLTQRAGRQASTMDLRLEGECNRSEFGFVPLPPHLPIPIAPFDCYARHGHPFFQPASCYPHGQYAIMEPIFYNGKYTTVVRWRGD